jgi:hypothetical protein
MTKSRGPLMRLLAVAAMLIAVVASSVAAGGAGANGGHAPGASQGDASEAARSAAAPRCLTWRRSSPTKAYDGGRTAGYSWAWNKVVGRGAPGGSTTRINRVKEIQCLLDYRGYNTFLEETAHCCPPPMEFWRPWGYYGAGTAGDVEHAQQACGIDLDGVVGPATWRCLRRDKNW